MRLKITLAALLSLTLLFNLNCSAKTPADDNLDSLKIVYFGSSVPFGIGATKNFGYTAMYTQLLKQRADLGIGKPWQTVNKSVGGDNTVKLLNRWSRDLASQKAKYVLYALSLGNEGIHEKGQASFDSFKNNMTKMIKMARDSGYTPVLANCYTRADFSPADHDFIKAMNVWIQTLDVPSINLLGAIDDGRGKWAKGYMADGAHPNDAGHREFFYAIVPSMFDALANHKPLPRWVNSTGVSWGPKNKPLISLKPENIVHAFTSSIDIKTRSKGQVLLVKDSSGNDVKIMINKNGFAEYNTPQGQRIISTTKVTDGKWHKITLSHFYARGQTDLYCDNQLQGSTSEQLKPIELLLGDNTGNTLQAKNWLFYRSAINALEVETLIKGHLLKSSLELYAPLDSKGMLVNLAQSVNSAVWVK